MEWMNVSSIVLGLVGLIIPIIHFINYKKFSKKYNGLVHIISFVSCGVAIVFQNIYTDYLLKIEDWTAILDTYSTITKISIILLAIITALNLIVYIVSNKEYKSRGI